MENLDPRRMKNWRIVLVIGWVFAILLFLYAWDRANAADLKVTWNANNEADLAGYKVYYAAPSDPGWAISNGTATYTLGTLPRSTALIPGTTHILTGVVPGPYAVAVTALDSTGNESPLSSVVSTLVPSAPQVIVVPPVQIPPGVPVQVIINLVP